MIGIYKITNPVGKVYIGQSTNIQKRIIDYSFYNCKGQTKLYRSLICYGWKYHKLEVIHELPADIEQEILDRYEQLYMDAYREAGMELLNLKEAGSHGKHSDETKKKIGEKSKRKNKWPGKTNFLGHHHSKKHKIYIKSVISIPINQFSLKGTFIKLWNSGKEASKKLNISAGNISSCCHGNIKSAGGFIWKFKNK